MFHPDPDRILAPPTKRTRLALAAIACLLSSTVSETQNGPTFSVATWNVRAGYGVEGVHHDPPFDMNTANCTDPERPRNAWGVGFTQRFLQAGIGQDPDVVALGLQEAWGNCGNVKNIASLLQWAAFAPERNGVGMVAKYGIVGPWDYWQIELKGVAGATEDRWIVGGNICVARDCVKTVYMWATHLAPSSDAEWPSHVKKALDWVATKLVPHLFVGDFNLWQNDQWSPLTNCGGATPPMAVALANIIRAGYVDAWAATQPGEGWTGMVSRNGCGPDRNGHVFKRIDYIWSKGLTAVSTTRIGVVAPGAPGPSDHLGLKAQFVIPGSRGLPAPEPDDDFCFGRRCDPR